MSLGNFCLFKSLLGMSSLNRIPLLLRFISNLYGSEYLPIKKWKEGNHSFIFVSVTISMSRFPIIGFLCWYSFCWCRIWHFSWHKLLWILIPDFFNTTIVTAALVEISQMRFIFFLCARKRNMHKTRNFHYSQNEVFH